jgi:hypothetical protein
MRKGRAAAAIAIGVAFVALVVLPFNRVPALGHAYARPGALNVSLHCGPPIVDAWRHDPAQSGWFGYAPLTSTPFAGPEIAGPCRAPARHRLESVAFLVTGAAVLAFVRRRSRVVGAGADR